MSNRDDHENGIDSAGPSQLAFEFTDPISVPQEEVEDVWHNDVLRTPMRILKNDQVQRHLSSLARTRKMGREPWDDWSDNAVVQEATGDKPPSVRTHHGQAWYLAENILMRASGIDRKERKRDWDRQAAQYQVDLNHLSLLDIMDISSKARTTASTKINTYISEIIEAIETTKKEIASRHKFIGGGHYGGPNATPYQTANYSYLDPIRYHPQRLTIKGGPNAEDWEGNVLRIAPRIQQPKQNRAGYSNMAGHRLPSTWVYETPQGTWEPFDGFRVYDNAPGSPMMAPDTTKLNLLLQYNLLPSQKDLLSDISGMPMTHTDEDYETLSLSMDAFNTTRASSSYTLFEDDDQLAKWFADNREDLINREGIYANSIHQLEETGIRALFNGLSDESDLNALGEEAEFMYGNHYLTAGNRNPVLARKAILARSERGTPDPDSAEVTGENRPVYPNGNHVPYHSLYNTHPVTGEKERDNWRNGWVNKYDRVLGFLHNTVKGRDIWQEALSRFSPTAEAQKLKDRAFIEKEFAALGMAVKADKNAVYTFTGGALKNMTAEAAADELEKEQVLVHESMLETNPEKKQAILNDLKLTNALEPHQVQWLLELKSSHNTGYNPEELFGEGIWQHLQKEDYQKKGEEAPPGLVQRRDLLFGVGVEGQDYYRRRAEAMAEDDLIGIPLAKSSLDGTSAADIFEAAEEGGMNIGIVNGVAYPKDELYRRRVGGKYQVVGVDDANHVIIAAVGASGEEYPVIDDEDTSQEAQDFVRTMSSITSLDTMTFAGGLSDFLGYTVIDKLVRDGIIAEEYATRYGEPEAAKRRESIAGNKTPKPPPFGDDDSTARIVLINEVARTFRNIRGLDNEEGMYRYEHIESDPYAAQAREGVELLEPGQKPGEGVIKYNIFDILYWHLNRDGSLIDEDNKTITDFQYYPEWTLNKLEEARQSEDPDELPQALQDIQDAINSVLGGAGGEEPPDITGNLISPGYPEDPRDRASRDAGDLRRLLQEELKRLTEEALQSEGGINDPAYVDMVKSFKERIAALREQELLHIENEALHWVNTDPQYEAYRKQIQQRHFSEILQDAPLNVRSTAFRHRIRGLNDKLGEAKTQGDLHDLARDWARTGLVEYKDILNIDRDGASKLQRVRRRLEATNGVDWSAIDKEYTDIKYTHQRLDEMILAAKEHIDNLKAAKLGTQPGDKEENFTPEAWERKEEADRRIIGVRKWLMTLEETPRYSFGSAEHKLSLKNHPSTQQLYETLDNTPIESIDPKLYEATKSAPNPVADAVRTGVNAWTESRLKGDFMLTGFLQALTATIGDASGIGGDKLRGMDVTKPLDQHAREYGGSWLDWLRPFPLDFVPNKLLGGMFDTSVGAVRRQQAGTRGEVYVPDPSLETEVYVGNEPTGITYADALEATEANIRTEAPLIEPPVQEFGPKPDTEEET